MLKDQRCLHRLYLAKMAKFPRACKKATGPYPTTHVGNYSPCTLRHKHYIPKANLSTLCVQPSARQATWCARRAPWCAPCHWQAGILQPSLQTLKEQLTLLVLSCGWDACVRQHVLTTHYKIFVVVSCKRALHMLSSWHPLAHLHLSAHAEDQHMRPGAERLVLSTCKIPHACARPRCSPACWAAGARQRAAPAPRCTRRAAAARP